MVVDHGVNAQRKHHDGGPDDKQNQHQAWLSPAGLTVGLVQDRFHSAPAQIPGVPFQMLPRCANLFFLGFICPFGNKHRHQLVTSVDTEFPVDGSEMLANGVNA
jgi:hypothetical protein